MSKKLLWLFLLIVVLAIGPAIATAAPIQSLTAGGGSVSVPDITPFSGASFIVGQTTAYSASGNVIGGNVTSDVFSDPSGIAIIYWLTNAVQSIDPVELFTVPLNPTLTYSIGYITNLGGTVVPLNASLTSGHVLNVAFGATSPNLLGPNTGSFGIVLQSNGTTYGHVTASELNRLPATNDVFRPEAAVPESSSITLLGLGLGLLGLSAMRRRRRAQQPNLATATTTA